MARPRQNRTGRPGRPQAPPPILRRRVTEPFEGADLLEEVRREQGALALWQGLRDVLLWAFAPADARREGLFSAQAGRTGAQLEAGLQLDPELVVPLHELSAVCTDPAAARPERLAVACRAISRWAEARSFPRAALAYAYAAAVVAPGSAEDSYRVGLLARREADYARAEAWFRRSIGLARRSKEARPHALALVGLGNLFMQRGDYPRAENAHRRALRMARRHGVREVKGMALHDLCVLAYESNQMEKAERYAYGALRAYGPEHPRLSMLAHDVAVFWLLQGKFDRALDAFKAVHRVIRDPAEQLWTLGTIAHAAGGAGRRDEFTSAWIQAWRIIDSQPATHGTGPALLNLAFGSAYLQDWERVEMAASHAVATAVRWGESRVRMEAEVLLESARNRSMPLEASNLYPPRDGEFGDVLATRLLEALHSMRA
ncbi:MAG TPA: tetratricopeptide repeat protein [Longimicrobiaceae bacterium]|nr:tetratricopeptide repeat protein [Longimicrobiaceae bacterium]